MTATSATYLAMTKSYGRFYGLLYVMSCFMEKPIALWWIRAQVLKDIDLFMNLKSNWMICLLKVRILSKYGPIYLAESCNNISWSSKINTKFGILQRQKRGPMHLITESKYPSFGSSLDRDQCKLDSSRRKLSVIRFRKIVVDDRISPTTIQNITLLRALPWSMPFS